MDASCIAFLIDADNLNDPEAVAEAFERLHALVGPSTVRRAYGSADSLKGLGPVLKQYAVRPCANFVLEKNTTDLALAVDAMELACEQRPAVLALGSGDSDFYPLVVRLRERGVRVIVFSLDGKMADDMRAACPELHFVGQPRPPRGRVARRVAAEPAPKAPAKPARKAVPPAVVADEAPAKKPAAKRTRVKPAAAPVEAVAPAAPRRPAAGQPLTVARILDLLPALRQGAKLHVSQAAQVLHEAEAIGRNASAATLFRKFGRDFELMPDSRRPDYVRWTGQPGD